MAARLTALLLLALLLGACSAQVKQLEPVVVNRYPHDPAAFTQGLLMSEGRVFESTGIYGASSMREVHLESGRVLRRVNLDDRYFGEGLELVGNRLIMLTWREGEALVFDAETFSHVETFTYDGEGWGLCYDGTELVMSDGSDELTFRDPETFEELRRVSVSVHGEPIRNINELECVEGNVYANVWLTREIIRIDPETGAVNAVIDASVLLTEAQWAALTPDATLNGIAWREERGTFLLTGKLWPWMFEVRFE